MTPQVDKIMDRGDLIAIIIRAEFDQPGIHFFTPPEFSQQLALMNHPSGKKIMPHVHNPVPREVVYTQEVLLVRKGRLKVTLYSAQRQFLCTVELAAGDLILLCGGGHGFEMLEETTLLEVKQGPYAGENDKTRFTE